MRGHIYNTSVMRSKGKGCLPLTIIACLCEQVSVLLVTTYIIFEVMVSWSTYSTAVPEVLPQDHLVAFLLAKVLVGVIF